MDRDRALQILREAAPELRRRYGVANARLFGSVARGTADTLSDVDVNIQFAGDRPDNSMSLCGVSGLLSEKFGLTVDVVADPVRNPALRAAILRDGVIAF